MVAITRGVFISPDTMYGAAAEVAQRQQVFNVASNKIVSDASRAIQEVMQDTSKDISELAIPLFYDLLAKFAKKRNQLAQIAKTPSKERFGIRPMDTEGDFFSSTHLHGVYEPANLAALEQLSERIQSIPFNGKKFAGTSHKTSEVVLGREFSCEIEIIDAETMQKRTTYTPQEEASLTALGAKMRKQQLEKPIYEFDREINKKYPHTHEKNRLKSVSGLLEKEYPSPKDASDTKYLINRKSHYIRVIMSTKIGHKMVPTTEWLTWLTQNGAQDPRAQMLHPNCRPVVSVITQDLFLHDETLKECARLFVEILKWDRKTANIEDLKDRVAVFRHLYARVSPHLRGSAAIGEWYEKSLYNAFGLTCTYTPAYPKESVDLVAQGKLKFSDYLRRYHTLVHIPGEKMDLAAQVASLELNDGKVELELEFKVRDDK